MGRAPEGIAHLDQVTRLRPQDAEACYNLGMALLQLGRAPEAIGQYEQALRLRPEHIAACRILAWLLATCGEASLRDGARAVTLAEKANAITQGKDSGILDTLAAAYAEAGRFSDAVRTAQAALELVKQAGPAEAARRIQERFELYQAGQAYRDATFLPK
jgi:Flp pilus assembly protein TadD